MKMTQEELAYKIKVSRQSISEWENDKRFPNMNNLRKLCQIFSINMDSLMKIMK